MISQEKTRHAVTTRDVRAEEPCPAGDPPRSRRSRRCVHCHGVAGDQQEEDARIARRDAPAGAGRDPAARLPAQRDGEDAWSAAAHGSSASSPTRSPRPLSPARSSTAPRTRPGSTATRCSIANTEGNRDLEKDAIAMMLEYKVRGILYSTWFHRATVIPETLQRDGLRPRQLLLAGPRRCPAVVPDEEQGGRQRPRSCSRRATAASLSSTPPPPRRPGTDGSRATRMRWRLPAFRSTRRWCWRPIRIRRADTARPRNSSSATSPPCTATTTAWRWACTTACASTGSPFPTTSPWWDSTTRKSSRPTSGRRCPPSPCPTTSSVPQASGVLLGLEPSPPAGAALVACPPVLRESIHETGVTAPRRGTSAPGIRVRILSIR